MNNKKFNNRSSIIGGLFWSFGERIIAQLVTTIVTIILARLLDPEHYGIISIVTIFITFCNIFVAAGFGSAVVQKKDSTDIDFNTAFVISFSVSILIYLLLFIIAPFIADFYEMPILTLVTRIMGIRLILASINNIQHAYVQKQMKFRKFFFATLIGTVISAIIGILLAYLDYGVWALVAQYLSNTTIDTFVLLLVCEWKPKFAFNKDSAKRLFSFGWKVLLTELIYTTQGDVRSLIVGKVFGPADLAYFDQGNKYPSFFVNNINSSINKVLLPAYSEKQDDKIMLKTMVRKSIAIGFFVLTPMLTGFFVLSKSFVLIFLTDKWIDAVPYIKIFCVAYLTRPLESSCHQALLAIGESGIVMTIILGINIVSIILILIAAFGFKSIFLIAICSLISTLVSFLLFMFTIYKKIDYKPLEQFYDIYKSILISLVMGVCVYFIGFVNLQPLLLFIIQILAGMSIYVFLASVFKFEEYLYIKGKLQQLFHTKLLKGNR